MHGGGVDSPKCGISCVVAVGIDTAWFIEIISEEVTVGENNLSEVNLVILPFVVLLSRCMEDFL